ncbi:MAG TPA: glucosidase [Phycisphaerales bacterium]|nr:glucosidase [Phycisphaerales bacterium]
MIRNEPTGPEAKRLADDASRAANWKRWGPYLSERQWGTVREDYSADGNCWTYFTHDQARSRAYRWGEDGILGITDRECRLCFALAMWNGKDPILKERLFGLTSPQGNHGEDVKESYFYLDSSPTHSYMRGLYKYPQNEYPYEQLITENQRRSRLDPEFELHDTGIFDESRYFDVQAEYAKGSPNDMLIRITVANRGPDEATLHLLPTLWFRNTWVWGRNYDYPKYMPMMRAGNDTTIHVDHPSLGKYRFTIEPVAGASRPSLLFTNNETNLQRLYGVPNATHHVKDAFHNYVVRKDKTAINPAREGTKAAALCVLKIPPGASRVINMRLSDESEAPAETFGPGFDRIFSDRIAETNEFYDRGPLANMNDEQREVARQAYAGLLWSKQFYYYVVQEWLTGDPDEPPPPPQRQGGRNADWTHLFNRDVISMPDKWEYPWYAAWDLAFHMVPMARVDPTFAKEQLLLLLREWYMHPNGQIPAYEFAFSDVNPPVHAWACWRVYKITGTRGNRDRQFLARAFQKLLINFTWWVNRKDPQGNHIFAGGFLGLDNIGVFDRSKPLPTGGHLEQADGTAWMAFYCGIMLAIALELASEDPTYDDVASKFFEHFVAIADAINTLGGTGLWDENDGFYYDQLHVDHTSIPLKVRSMVGLIPLLACSVIEQDVIDRLPGFAKRTKWFVENRKDLARHISHMASTQTRHGKDGQITTYDNGIGRPHDHSQLLLAIPSKERLLHVLRYLLDDQEFLSPYGIRSLSRVHAENPYVFYADGQEYRVDYVPGESTNALFGGNSNWRGPIWFPVNYLLIESLERYGHFYGDDVKVECPTGSGRMMTLVEAGRELRRRLTEIFMPNAAGRRACHGTDGCFAEDKNWKNLVLFHEYFHADNGRGVGASHQTGWTALVTECLLDISRQDGGMKSPKHAYTEDAGAHGAAEDTHAGNAADSGPGTKLPVKR